MNSREEALRRLRDPVRNQGDRSLRSALDVLGSQDRRRFSTWLLAAAAWLDRPGGYTPLVRALDWSAGTLIERRFRGL